MGLTHEPGLLVETDVPDFELSFYLLDHCVSMYRRRSV